MRRYYITDRRGCPDLMDCIARAAADGVELIQIREKDLTARDLLALVRAAVQSVSPWRARILVNGRVDIALAGNAHGVHLPSDSAKAREWRRILPPDFLIGVSCHSSADIRESEGADLLVYGPVFDSPGKGQGVGLDALRAAAASTRIPVFALGGITRENAASCIEAGAAGVAAIRMFQGAPVDLPLLPASRAIV
jgi:thiamine-phosphate pyrophosphorylase